MCDCGRSLVDDTIAVASGGDAERDPARQASRKRLAFWVWMSGIGLIVTGAAIAGDRSMGGVITGTVGVILCLIGRFTRIAAEQRRP